MPFVTMKARFPGTCKRCRGPIKVGQKMRYGGYGRTYHLVAECGQTSPTKERSGGICEDAPCCGCCGQENYSYAYED